MTVIAVYLQRNGDIQQISKIAYDVFFLFILFVRLLSLLDGLFFLAGSVAAP